MNRVVNWKPIIEIFVEKLSSWNGKLFSIGGRLILLKAILGNIVMYYMSVFKAPDIVLKMLESLRGRFFWVVDVSERKIHWIAWNHVFASNIDGGLGIGSLNAYNKALLFKWYWRFFKDPLALWAKIITTIHGDIRGGSMIYKNTRGLSPWVSMLKGVEKLKLKGINLYDY